MSGISIITIENRRLYPVKAYDTEENNEITPIIDIDSIYDLLNRREKIFFISNQYDQYGRELDNFYGYIGSEDIKALFYVNDEELDRNLSAIMTLSEAAKKWGFSDGSTIRKAIERGKFERHEIKQAGDIWITTYDAMERVFGKIKNEENELIIYDDFESNLYRLFLKDVQRDYLREKVRERNLKENEILYNNIREVLISALVAIRKGNKVIIKNKRSNKTKQVINTERELFVFIELFSRRNLMTELRNNQLLEDFKKI
ncbi:hypothetical protein JHL18_21840 [Clostridium sp. YIM B02505]|uniref:Helix-turn-helix domain-containing protein n=1 Tax=Clostridium yunnanense TaxID=2800325 RepID=A0ABS1EVA9_9CLOT|nr:helix-turn-helix domain-containing protein [Clostridium yunnanense]MBK1813268.1 hypothetical protein [Clostridium yunnanense]